MNLPVNLNKKLEKRKEDNAFRVLKAQNQGVDFSSNDYLGFSKSEEIYHKTLALLNDKNIKNNGATGSRLLTGNHPLFLEAELQLANFHHAESALICNSGYDANIGLISAVAQRGDYIFYDEYIHASLRDGIQLSNAKAYKFNHNNLADLEIKIERIDSKSSTIYIVTESIFSMDGDSPDLKELVNLAKRYSAFLIIDEAHGTGVFAKHGAGLIRQLNLENDIFARIHTFGKAIGCHGAAILGCERLTEYLINYSRSFIYSTALSPYSIANIIVAYQTLEKTNSIEKLIRNISYFKDQIFVNGLASIFRKSDSQIQCCIISGNERVKKIAKILFEGGFDVKPILSPTVSKDEERLRFCIHSYNSFGEIKSVLGLLSKYIKPLQ